jgi:UDP-GlcNAc:undecaprenyl-phosphate GlcNAc-1-phosphate transferase
MIAAFLLTPITGRLALRFDVIDHPSQDPAGHKGHTTPTPYLGGIAIIVGLALGASVMLAAVPGIPVRYFLIVLGAGAGLGLVGLIDDVKPLPRSLRLVAQMAAAIAAWQFGFGVTITNVTVVDLGLTILWLVGVTNAFNLLDNMDGVSSGLAGIAAASFALMGIANDLPLLPIIAAALAGACFGFLVHNRHPAKVFMGDAGSLFIGFLVGLIGLRLRFQNPVETTFLVPAIVLGIPLLDTTLVVLSRLRHRQPVFLGARDHVTHRLVGKGLTIKAAVALLYWVAVCLAWLGFVVSQADADVAWMLTGFIVVMGIFLGGVLWGVPVYPARKVEELAPAAGVDLEEALEEGIPAEVSSSSKTQPE